MSHAVALMQKINKKWCRHRQPIRKNVSMYRIMIYSGSQNAKLSASLLFGQIEKYVFLMGR